MAVGLLLLIFTITLGSGEYNYQYDALNRLTNLTNHRDSDKTDTINSYEYRLAADGSRLVCVGEQPYEGNPTNTTFEWTYDNLNRLTDETCYDGTPEVPDVFNYEDSYEYDLAGNRTKRLHSEGNQCMQTDYEYNERNQLVKEKHNEPFVCFYLHDKPVYAYAANGRITHYRLSGSSQNIGPFRAWLLGIPTQWSNYLFNLVAVLLPLVFLSPTFRRIISRGRRPASLKLRRARPLLRQGLILLIAYVMFISPEGFYQLSCYAGDYNVPDREITYTYDDNGSLESKTLVDTSAQETLEVVVYEYNLQNRLARIITTPYENGQPQTQDAVTVTYRYNPDGIRDKKVVNNSSLTLGMLALASFEDFGGVVGSGCTLAFGK